MYQVNFRRYCTLALAMIGAAVLTGCSTPNVAYRAYYQDSNCRYFYVDSSGNRVYEWGTGNRSFSDMRMCQRDAMGRLYYQDSFGNRFYKQRVCR